MGLLSLKVQFLAQHQCGRHLGDMLLKSSGPVFTGYVHRREHMTNSSTGDSLLDMRLSKAEVRRQPSRGGNCAPLGIFGDDV